MSDCGISWNRKRRDKMNLKGKKGVDISAANGNVSIEKIKAAGYDFVMIRCGFGSDISSQDDSQFESNVRKCEAAGVPWGTYLYSYSLSESDAKSEAAHVKRLLKGKKPTLPVALDMEDADGYKARNGGMTYKNINSTCKIFLEEISKAGYYPMLYTGLYYLDDYISKAVYQNYDLWIAQWNSVCQYSGSNLGMWQYGGETNFIESNSIPGVGVIDKDRCYRDYPAIIKDGGYNGWNKTDSEVKIKADSKLRSQAYCGGDSKILAELKKGTVVKFNYDEGYGWSNITANGKTGFVQNTRLTKSGLTAYPKKNIAVPVFEKPDCGSKIIGKINSNQKYSVRYIIEKGIGEGFAEITYPDSGGTGFVYAEFL